jgi:hypothetical protein
LSHSLHEYRIESPDSVREREAEALSTVIDIQVIKIKSAAAAGSVVIACP